MIVLKVPTGHTNTVLRLINIVKKKKVLGITHTFCNEKTVIFSKAWDGTWQMFTKNEVTFLENGSTRDFPSFTRNHGKSQSVQNLSYRRFMYTAMPHLLLRHLGIV